MKKCLLIFVLICFLVFSAGAVIMAATSVTPESAGEGRLTFGNARIIPGVTITEQYDDNIYLGSGDNNTTERETSDWITHLKPQLLTQYTIPGRGFAGLGYQGNYAYYSDYDTNNWQSHSGVLEVDYEAPAGLIAGGRHMYMETEDPYGSDTEYKSGVPLTDRTTNTSKWRLGLATPEMFKFLVYYNYYKQDYDNDLLDYSQDYKDNEFGCGLRVRAGGKTWAFFRWFRGHRDYYTHPIRAPVTDAIDADYEWQRVNFGLLWEKGARFSGEFNIGYKDMDYDHETLVGGAEYDDEATWIAATAVTYHIAPETQITLNLSNDLMQVGSDTNNYYEDTRVGLKFTQVMLKRIQLQAEAVYRKWDYYRNSRDEDDYIVSLDVDYLIRPWLIMGAGYFHKDKKSSTNSIRDRFGDDHEYTVNRYTFRVKAVF